MQQIEITKEEIIALREQGYTVKDIAIKYNTNVPQVNRLYKSLGIKGRPKNKPVFIVKTNETKGLANESIKVPQYIIENNEQETKNIAQMNMF